MANTILIDGTDIATTARIVKQWEGVHDTATLRGNLVTYPGADGETDTDQPFGPTILGLGLVLLGSTITTFNDQYQTLRRLCRPGGTVTLTKQLDLTAGTQSYTATCKLRRCTPSQLSPSAYAVALEFSVLDGVWHGSQVTQAISNGSNTPSISGELRTKRMTITLTGGTTPTLTNSTTGHSLHFNGTMSAPVIIDVENGTATRSSADVSEALTWTKLSPFALLPGTNTIVLAGGGSASIAYYPAY